MNWISTLGGLFLAMGCMAGTEPAQAVDPPAHPGAARSVARLGWDLVRRAGDGNVVLSPSGVWEALAMAQTGARGTTASEMAAVLGMPDDPAAMPVAAAELRGVLAAAAKDGITLDVANRLWVQRGVAIEAPFATSLETGFGARAGLLDFAGASESSREEINLWVRDRTAGRIDELLRPGDLGPRTRFVLTNAVYLKAPWSVPFERSSTSPAPFTLAGGGSIDVPFMNRTGPMNAGAMDGATVLEIPYAGDRLAMIVIVPDTAGGSGRIVAGLGEDWMERWSATARRRRVALALPRFTARRPLSLAPALGAMGMKEAFTEGRADFSGIDGSRDLFISAIVHEGFVDVTEEGTEAAAATAVVGATRSRPPAPEEPLVVKADRPFVWAVIDRASGTILFAGVVRDPRG